MKKVFYVFAGTLSGFLLVLITAITLLLGTEAGLSWALRQSDRVAPNLFAFDGLEGHLLDRLHLRKIQLNLPTMRMRIEDFVFDWQPSKLFQREFHLALLKIDAMTIDTVGLAKETPETVPEEPVYPIELPDLELPLTVIIDSVQINGIEMVSDPNIDPMRIETIALQARWDEEGMQLQQLDVAMPGLAFEADGRLTPVGDYPLEIHTLLRLAHESLPKGQLQGTIEGDKNQIGITQRFTGDAQIELVAALTQPLENLGWNGTLTVLEVPGRLISPEFPAHIKGRIDTQGDLKGAQLDGHLLVASPSDPMIDLKSEFAIAADFEQSSILIRKLQAAHQTQPMRVSMSGSASLEGKRFDLKGGWQDVQWPLTGESIASSTMGKFSANGSAENYQFKVAIDLSGKDIPKGQWTINGAGNDERLNHFEVVGQTLDGVLKTIGQASWVPAVSYDLTTTAQHINPGAQYPDWPGAIDMDSRISGKLTEAGPIADVVLKALTGELRGLPIRGRGVVKVNPDVIDVDGFVIGSGNSEIRADGKLGEKSRLSWEIDIPEASDLIPQATGRLVGQGMVQGPKTQPRISAQLKAESLRAEQLVLDHLAVDLDVDLSYQRKSTITLTGQGLKAGAQQINQLSVNADGTLDIHKLETVVSHELGQLKLALQGGIKDELWKGQLRDLSLESGDFGNWDLERPAELMASATKASAAPLCMKRESARLCAQGKWDKLDEQRQRSSGGFEIAAFPLAWLEPWLPEDIRNIDGEVTAKGDVDMGQKLQAKVDVNITPGQIVYLHPEAGEVSIPHDGVKLLAYVKGNGARGDVKLGLAGNKITAGFDSPNVLAVDDPMQAKIGAHITLDGPSLDFVTTMVPQLTELKGSILLDFDVQGTAGHPRLDGKGKIDIARLDAPEFGVALNDSSIDIYGKGEALEIEGLLASTKGKINIKGNSKLDAQSGWPTKLKIEGDNFLAVNLPEASLYISPDLFIEKTAQALRLAGRTTVPKADIFLKTLPPSARSAHSDVVVIQETDLEEAPQPMPLEMDVTLTLGEEIHFVGFGLDAYFDGELKATAKPNEALSVAGDIRIDQGTFRAYGQDLSIEQGIISFAGGPPGNPGINLRATRQIDEVIAGINAIGPIKKPRLTTFSTPAMSENDIISYLLTGRPARDAGGGGGKLAVGRQINSKLSVEVGTDLDTGEAEFSSRYRLSRKTHVEATTTPRSSAADIFYTWELE
ncbi:MAG: translocation/assembly module TamB domain-containing protein [Pseudomonadota bacterium]